jgi:hypothetical protein
MPQTAAFAVHQFPRVFVASALYQAAKPGKHMEELVRTNDPVLISFLESILEEAGIKHFVADGNMSIMEGSLAMIPRRILVDADQIQKARNLVRDAGLEHELRPVRDRS